MSERIIYADRPFCDKFIEEVHTIASGYIFKIESQPEDLRNVEISLGWNPDCQEKLLASSTLKWVQPISAGTDQLPLETLSRRHILLSNGSGIHSESITGHVLGIILGYSRGFSQTQKTWSNMKWLGSSVHYQSTQEKKILVIGTDHIGKMIVRKYKALGMDCYGVNTSGHPAERTEKTFSLNQLKEVLPEAGFVVNILPLAEETTRLFNQHMFEHFDPKSVFISVGRGTSVKAQDLVQALNNRRLSFAALDVFEEEPLPQDHPLWKMDSVLITSHIAGLTPDFQKKLIAIFLANLKSYFATHELQTNQVELSTGY